MVDDDYEDGDEVENDDGDDTAVRLRKGQTVEGRRKVKVKLKNFLENIF